MQRAAIYKNEWVCSENDNRHPQGVAGKILDEAGGIIKDTLVMSVVVMAAATLMLLL